MTETRVLAEICFGSRWARCGNTLAAGSAFVDGKLMTAGLLARSFDSAGGALESMPSRCNGFFAVVSVSESTIFAAVDRVRSIPVFYCIDNGKVLLSDDPHLIRERAGIENKDGPAEKELLLTRYVTGPDTLYTQIKQLQAGEYLFIDRYVAIEKQRAAKRYYIFTHTDLNGGSGRKLDRAEKEREFRELTERNIGELDKAFCRLAEYAAGRPIVVPLSGGYDSRLVVLMLKRTGFPDVRTFTFGKRGNPDTAVSKKVADNLDLPWTAVHYDGDEIFEMINSKEWKRYDRMADGLCCTCFDRDWPALRVLKNKKYIPDEAVIVPGHSGDFIGGGHIREGFARKRPVSPDEFAGEILDRHYTMWQWSGQEKVLRPELAERILRCAGVDSDMDRETACDAYERWVWQEFQSKYLVNGVRVYEFWGYDWWLPLWDAQYMDFWSTVPLRWRLGKKLYDETVFRLYTDMAHVTYGEAKLRNDSKGALGAFSGGAERAVKNLIRSSPLRPAISALRERLRRYVPSLPRSETMELDWEQCQGRLSKSLYEALAPFMTNRSSSVTLEKLGYIRFDDKKVSSQVLAMLRQMRGAGLSGNRARAKVR